MLLFIRLLSAAGLAVHLALLELTPLLSRHTSYLAVLDR